MTICSSQRDFFDGMTGSDQNGGISGGVGDYSQGNYHYDGPSYVEIQNRLEI